MDIRFQKLGLFLLTLLIISPGCQTAKREVAQAIQAGDAHLAAGEYTYAQTAYRRAQHLQPDDPMPAWQLAKLYARWERPQAGLEALTQAHQLGWADAEVQNLRLHLLAQAGQWDRVYEESKIHILNTGITTATLTLLAEARLHQHECELAHQIATQGERLSEPAPQLTYYRATLEGDDAQLCTTYPALCVDTANCAPNCDLQLGYRLLREESWPLAACVLERALETAPDSAQGHAWLGEALNQLGHTDLAAQHLHQATQLAPEAPLGWLLLGTYYLRQGAVETARDALLQAQRLDPANPAPCLALAEVKAQSGHYDEIETWTQAALERAPDDADIWKAVARFYLERNLQQAPYPTKAAQGAVDLAPQDAEAHMLLGWAYLAQKQNAQARLALETAIDLDPTLGQAHYLRGLALQAAGEVEAAQAAITRAADLGYPRPQQPPQSRPPLRPPRQPCPQRPPPTPGRGRRRRAGRSYCNTPPGKPSGMYGTAPLKSKRQTAIRPCITKTACT